MDQLIFATHNENKVEEVNAVLNGRFKVVSLKQAGIEKEIPEPFDTLEENAREKARAINHLTRQDCFSEDTGLEAEALGGEPGVKSARYAGEERSFEKNIDKLLNKLQGQKSRKAQFRTVICLIMKGEEKLFEGICKGTIIAERRGSAGFGYDPVFVPDGATRTFAEMSMDEKNKFSHRRKALDKLVSFLALK